MGAEYSLGLSADIKIKEKNLIQLSSFKKRRNHKGMRKKYRRADKIGFKSVRHQYSIAVRPKNRKPEPNQGKFVGERKR